MYLGYLDCLGFRLYLDCLRSLLHQLYRPGQRPQLSQRYRLYHLTTLRTHTSYRMTKRYPVNLDYQLHPLYQLNLDYLLCQDYLQHRLYQSM